MNERNGNIASPCINICRLDAESGICEGCFRHVDEIAGWQDADDQRKRDILKAAAARKRAAGGDGGGSVPSV